MMNLQFVTMCKPAQENSLLLPASCFCLVWHAPMPLDYEHHRCHKISDDIWHNQHRPVWNTVSCEVWKVIKFNFEPVKSSNWLARHNDILSYVHLANCHGIPGQLPKLDQSKSRECPPFRVRSQIDLAMLVIIVPFFPPLLSILEERWLHTLLIQQCTLQAFYNNHKT